ncbi:phosphate ABC transporter substrate-binding protein [Alteromonas stellipolaris]|uniref:Phosphate ABC transporter substrate-binding protein n=2 Tax=Alteromonas TaxID=226 RepID=A0AAW7Z1T1_9ALTE|nr:MULTISPECIES: phosphate ABC transporter substrate-binding protein [Alteromonas]MDO6577212.1 phosphate ABC transporter substrate-binding protein [Alteromonas stellipolaris]
MFALPVSAANVIIVSAKNGSGIDAEAVKRIYLGKMKAFPDGSKALPLTFEQGNDIRSAFNTGVLGKSESQYSAFWSKLVFTGQGTPPEEVSTQEEMLQLVADNPNTIGFVDESLANDSVTVVGSF